jgi:hypothetical protein
MVKLYAAKATKVTMDYGDEIWRQEGMVWTTKDGAVIGFEPKSLDAMIQQVEGLGNVRVVVSSAKVVIKHDINPRGDI